MGRLTRLPWSCRHQKQIYYLGANYKKVRDSVLFNSQSYIISFIYQLDMQVISTMYHALCQVPDSNANLGVKI